MNQRIGILASLVTAHPDSQPRRALDVSWELPLRIEAQLTRQELAKAAGVSPLPVSDLERGINRTARKDSAVQLAGSPGERRWGRLAAAARGDCPAGCHRV